MQQQRSGDCVFMIRDRGMSSCLRVLRDFQGHASRSVVGFLQGGWIWVYLGYKENIFSEISPIHPIYRVYRWAPIKKHTGQKISCEFGLPPQNRANPARNVFPRRPTRLKTPQTLKSPPNFLFPICISCGGGSHVRTPQAPGGGGRVPTAERPCS